MRSQQHIARESLQTLVHGLNGLHVEVVCRLVEQHHVRAREHHPREHAAHLLAAGEHVHGLKDFIAREQHPTQKAAQVYVVLFGRELANPVDERIRAAVKIRRIVLGQVAGRDGLTPFDAALVRLQLTHEDFEHCRLRQLIFAYEGDLVVFADDKADLVQELHAVNGLGYVSDEQNILADLAFSLEAHERIPARGRGHFLHRQLVKKPSAGRSLLALGLVGGKARDEGLQLSNLFLISLVFVADELLDELRRLVPEVVVTDILLDFAVVNIDDMRADGIQKVAVVADHDDKAGVFIVQNEVFQPVDGLNIEVVGRLVEHDHVGLAEQRLRQQHLHLIPGVGVRHEVIVVLHGDAKALQKPAGIGLGFPAVHLGELDFQLTRAHAVFFREVLFFVQRVLFLHHVVQVLVAHDDGVEHRVCVILELILLQHRHPRAGLEGDRTGRWLQLAGENL